MKEHSTSKKLLVVVGFLASVWAFAWLPTLPARSFSLPQKWGVMCAMLVVCGVMVYFWSFLIVLLGQNLGWLPSTCAKVSLLLLVVPGTVWFFLGEPTASYWATALVGLGPISGYLCRKIADPEMSDEGGNLTSICPADYALSQISLYPRKTPQARTLAPREICCHNPPAARRPRSL